MAVEHAPYHDALIANETSVPLLKGLGVIAQVAGAVVAVALGIYVIRRILNSGKKNQQK